MTEKEKYKLSTYEPVKVIRETEASKVELAECSLDGKKYIKKTYHSDKRAVFNIIADIKNEHMPKIYEIFFGEDTIIIEQYIEGKTLAQEISEGKVFSKARIKSVFGDLTEAVDALHKNNIVHRDIKPSNIIIKENGDAVLIDYSIARPYSDKRNADTELFGTVGYAAPEQFGFSQSDFRTDIYALGVTMKEIANRHNTSKRLYSAISRCTEFDPSRRFQTIDELRKYLNGTKKHIAVGTAVCLTAVSVFAVICVCLNSVKGKDDLNELSEQYEQTLQASVSESETEITTSEVTTSQDRHYENVKTADVIYKPSSARIVNTSFVRDGVPCIKMWEDGSYKAEIPVGDDAPPIRISAEKKDSKCTVNVNSEIFSFEDTYVPEIYYYEDSSKVAEIIFYDMNCDGILDILPVMSDALIVHYSDDDQLRKNYSVAWCIYSDSQGNYQMAEGEMIARYTAFKTDDSAPGCLYADFMDYYTLEDGVPVLH